MPHYLELLKDMPQGSQSCKGYCRDQEEYGFRLDGIRRFVGGSMDPCHEPMAHYGAYLSGCLCTYCSNVLRFKRVLVGAISRASDSTVYTLLVIGAA